MIKTVSLETAKLLKEAGFPQTSILKYYYHSYTGNVYHWDENVPPIEGESVCRPTTDELLEELPSTIDKTPIGSIGQYFLEIVKWDDGYYYSAYYNPKIHTSSCELVGYRDKEVVETLAQLWFWLNELRKSNLLSGKGKHDIPTI